MVSSNSFTGKCPKAEKTSQDCFSARMNSFFLFFEGTLAKGNDDEG
jgi:hypothetical protein